VPTQQRSNYTTISFELRRDYYAQLKKMFPRYGQVSKVMRVLVAELLSGRVKVKN
jgi:hypothetical protein